MPLYTREGPSSETKSSTGKHDDEHRKGHIVHVGWIWSILPIVAMFGMAFFEYWSWASVEVNKGAMLRPRSLALTDIRSFVVNDVWKPVAEKACPSIQAFLIYGCWIAFQAALHHFGPGPVGPGQLLPDGTRLGYKYNGPFGLYTTLVVAAVLHVTHLFPLTTLVTYFPQLLSVCAIYSCAVSAALYIWSVVRPELQNRMTDSITYNYFMGTILNPRIGDFDLKYFHELRPGMFHWLLTTVAFAVKMYEDEGKVSWPMLLLCFYHWTYVNACQKGEYCVPKTMDIVYENFGFMLLFLDVVMVPFIFPMQAFYLYKVGYFEHPWYISLTLFVLHCLGYWIFDTSNSQKDYFRMKKEERIEKRFPRLPWEELENPKYMPTKRGTKLLVDGWWQYARHVNYTGDIIMSWVWGLTCGVSSYFPFTYTTYLTSLLLHRERRDDRDCQEKYGDDWVEYKRRVPYRLIPYVY